MTNTTTTASNGSTTTTTPVSLTESGDGLIKLRRQETKGLISLACDAIGETHHVAHETHSLIYAKDREFRPDQIERMTREILACWQTAEHYLLMLSSVLADYDPYSGSDLSGLLHDPSDETPF